MTQKYCSCCLQPVRETDRLCPFCGKPVDAEAPYHQLLPGTVLRDRYYIGAALGQEGFCITYAGFDMQLLRKVAVKEYFPNGFVNRNNTVSSAVIIGTNEEERRLYENGKQRFLEEARTLAGFSGIDGIVNVMDCFPLNNTVYIIMELIEGITLKQYVGSGGKIPVADAINLLTPVMQSLRQIHEKGLIHRDISPDNIILVQNGDRISAKLTAFDAAREVDSVGSKSLTVVPEPGFSPIEQYTSTGTQGAWTDVYAMCATIYFCATGTAPQSAPDRIIADGLQKISALGGNADEHTERVLEKGLSLLYQDRYVDMRALLDALIVPGKPLPPVPAASPEPPASPKPSGSGSRFLKMLPFAAAILVLAVAVTGITALVLRREPETDASRADGNASQTKPAESRTAASADAAAQGFCGAGEQNVQWVLNGNGELILSGTGETASYQSRDEIPWEAQSRDVLAIIVEEGITAIGSKVFCNCVNAKTVSLPASLQSIKALAFQQCRSLTTVMIPEGVTSVAGTAFDACQSLKRFIVSGNNTAFAVYGGALCSFDREKLIRVPSTASGEYIVPPEVSSIGADAFCGSGIEAIRIHSGVEQIGSFAFDGCDSLVSVIVDEKNPVFVSRDNVVFNRDQTKLLFFPPGLRLDEYRVPASVKEIGEAAFTCANTSRIVFPETIEKIGPVFIELARNDMDLVFLGDAPEFAKNAFFLATDRSVTVTYDKNTQGWEEAKDLIPQDAVSWKPAKTGQ